MTTIKGRNEEVGCCNWSCTMHPQRQTVQPKIIVKQSVVKLVFMSKYCFKHAHMVAIAMVNCTVSKILDCSRGWLFRINESDPPLPVNTHYYDYAHKFHKARPLFHPSLVSQSPGPRSLTLLCQRRRKLSESRGANFSWIFKPEK